MKKPINEIERLKLIAGLINEVEYNNSVHGVKKTLTEVDTKEAKADEAVKAEVKVKAPSTKKPKELHIDHANPYEYRHGLQYELEQLDDYSDEALEKAKSTVLKNLAKDVNFYSNLLNAKQSPFTFKATETDAKGMQANADGHLKKEAKKDEKANVQDSLGKKEAGKKKPKGIKVMPDKGVTGSEKTIKEGLEEISGNKIHAMLDKVADDWGKDSDLYSDLEDAIIGWSDRNNELTPKGKIAIRALLSNWDMLDDYEQFLNDDDIDLYPGNMGDEMSAPTSMEEDLPGMAGGMHGDEDFRKAMGIEDDSPYEDSAEDQFNQLMSKYDWYYEMGDDHRAWERGNAMDKQLKALGKQIGVDKAVALFNDKAPSDRKVTSTFFMEGEDKHAKLKEALKSALKKEAISASELIQAKQKGQIVKIPKTSTQDIQAAEKAKANYSTYE